MGYLAKRAKNGKKFMKNGKKNKTDHVAERRPFDYIRQIEKVPGVSDVKYERTDNMRKGPPSYDIGGYNNGSVQVSCVSPSGTHIFRVKISSQDSYMSFVSRFRYGSF